MTEFSIFQSIATFGATLTAIYVGINGLHTWKRKIIWPREQELLDEIVVTFFEAEDRLIKLREPIVRYEELKAIADHTVAMEGDHIDLETLKHNVFLQIPLERHSQQSDFWESFRAQRLKVRALLGADWVKPYDDVLGTLNRYNVAAGTMRETFHVDWRSKVTAEDQRELAEWREPSKNDLARDLSWSVDPRPARDGGDVDALDDIAKIVRQAADEVETKYIKQVRKHRLDAE